MLPAVAVRPPRHAGSLTDGGGLYRQGSSSDWFGSAESIGVGAEQEMGAIVPASLTTSRRSPLRPSRHRNRRSVFGRVGLPDSAGDGRTAAAADRRTHRSPPGRRAVKIGPAPRGKRPRRVPKRLMPGLDPAADLTPMRLCADSGSPAPSATGRTPPDVCSRAAMRAMGIPLRKAP